MEKEIDYLGPRRQRSASAPVAAIIGGAKISSKIAVLQHLLSKVNVLLIGGGMASTFLKARGIGVGASLVEDDQLATARDVIAEAGRRGVKLGLPIDAVIADRFAADAATQTVDVHNVPEGWMILDIGPKTVADYEAKLRGVKTVVWNGPLGVAEWEPFAQGSNAVARFLAKLDATVVIGGGETVAMVTELGLADRVRARLDGRRRVAGVPRRQGAAGRGGAARQVACAAQPVARPRYQGESPPIARKQSKFDRLMGL